MKFTLHMPSGAVPIPAIKGLDAVIGRAVFRAVQQHFRDLDARRHRGGHSRHFYGEAAKGTFDPNAGADEPGTAYSTALGYPAVVVNKLGIRQRILGGDIVPRNSKMLAIGSDQHPETWDESPRHFVGLKMRWGKDRSGVVRPMALTRDDSGLPVQRQTASKKWKSSPNKSPSKGKWDVFYWLAYRVTQQPDPSVAPDLNVMQAAGYDAARMYLEEKGIL